MTGIHSPTVNAFIVVGIRWTDRLIGLLSTIILARLLLPEDFGVVAMALLVIGFVDMLLDMGVNITLVQKKLASEQDYYAAWTLRLLQSGLSSIIILLISYPVAAYFNDFRIISVVQVLAITVLLAGFENIGIISFQKKMEFHREFRFYIGKRIVGFVATIIAAIYLQNYWALVIGTLAGRVTGVLLSYVMHPMRPKFSFVGMAALLSFSIWNLFRSITGYLNENIHRLFVGARESASVMGSYTLANDIAAMPSSDLLAPLNRVFFPLFVSVKDDEKEFGRLVLLAISIQALIGVPIGVGLAMVAFELVHVMLGEVWSLAISYIQIIGFINSIGVITASCGYALLALGKAREAALLSSYQVLIFVAIVYGMFPSAGAIEITGIRLGVAVFALLMPLVFISKNLPSFKLISVFYCILRPCVGATFMSLVLYNFAPMFELTNLAMLVVKVITGAIVYCSTVLGLWYFSGQPVGSECYLLEKFNLYRNSR